MNKFRIAVSATFSLRLDGFSSVHAAYHGGEMITQPFVFTGKGMEIHFSTSEREKLGLQLRMQMEKPYQDLA